MKFLKTILRTVYDPQLYVSVAKQPFGETLKFFFKIASILVALSMIFITTGFLNEVVGKLYPQFRKGAIESFPAGLEVTIKDGQASVNQPGPHFIKVPEGANSSGEDLSNLLVIDVETPYSLQKFKDYNAVAWLTKDSLVLNKVEGRTESLSLSEFREEPLVVNRGVIESWIKVFDQWSWVIALFILLLLAAGIYIVTMGHLFYLLFLALAVWLLTKLFGFKYQYGQAYTIALYGSIFGWLLTAVLNQTSLSLPMFVPSLISLAIIGWNVNKVKALKT